MAVSLTRRQALRTGALTAVLAAGRLPSPALAAGPALFESDLSGELAGAGAADEYQLRLRGSVRRLRARFVRALPTR
ncbi:MAG: hypothetical protein QOK21_4397 [Solirubrobacteraceae bacterium]|nr:hypothetical protein [Solirubrobacteraceae bacterium]